MADRNPYIPSERRLEMEEREQDNEAAANRRFAERQTELKRGEPERKRKPVFRQEKKTAE